MKKAAFLKKEKSAAFFVVIHIFIYKYKAEYVIILIRLRRTGGFRFLDRLLYIINAVLAIAMLAVCMVRRTRNHRRYIMEIIQKREQN